MPRSINIKITKYVLDRFNKDIEKRDNCWIWKGNLDKDGYGKFFIDYRHYRAHRFSYYIYHKDFNQNLLICHSCDNTSCVNPKHLFQGTNIENLRDMKDKGRSSKGIKNASAKLKESDIPIIRELLSEGIYQEKIAKKYKVSQYAISRIKLRKNWTHV